MALGKIAKAVPRRPQPAPRKAVDPVIDGKPNLPSEPPAMSPAEAMAFVSMQLPLGA